MLTLTQPPALSCHGPGTGLLLDAGMGMAPCAVWRPLLTA